MSRPARDLELHELDARVIADGVRSGRIRATEVLEHSLERIERINPELNAMVFLDAERALRTAASVDARVAAGEDPGPLAGVPLLSLIHISEPTRPY